MPRFAVAFITPTENGQLIHRLVESQDKESALRSFFSESVSEFYSADEQGFHYFKDDFLDDVSVSGSIIEV